MAYSCDLREAELKTAELLTEGPPQDHRNSESKVAILSHPGEYTNTERLDQYVIIISFIFIPLARTWLYVPINLQGRLWKCSIYLNIHLPSKNYDFFLSIIKGEEYGYLWQLAGSSKWKFSHYQITTDLLLLLLLIPFWGSNFSHCQFGDPLDMHNSISSSLFSLLPIL